MTSAHSQRKLSNIKLTRKYYFRYLGIWMLISACLLILLNVTLYLLIEARWTVMSFLDSDFHAQYVPRLVLLGVLGIETVLLVIGIVWLAKFTAHRVAGPYIRLTTVFEAVRDGNLGQDLKFRGYDHLEEVEKAFHEMMATIRERNDRAPEGRK